MVTETLDWIELEETASTSSWLIDKVRSGELTGAAGVRAHRQTAGRGRMGRVWQAKEGDSCCFSVALPLRGMPSPSASVRVGVEISTFLSQQGARGLTLKWPNDLLFNGRKAGGILCESLIQDNRHWLVVGVGLNVRQPDLPLGAAALEPAGLEEAWPLADSLLQPEGLCRQLAQTLVQALREAEGQSFSAQVARFNRVDAFRGLPIKVLDGGKSFCEGKGRGVDELGQYLIETEEGIQSVASGELSLRLAI